MRILPTISYSLLAITSCFADSWSVNVNDHAAVQRTYKQGESHELRIILRDGLKPLDLTGATARFYWFTNAVQNVWWTNSAAIPTPKAGLVQTTWTPAMDIGVASYAYWVGIWPAGSTSPLWRVTGTIRLLPSPGFTPNALVPPVRTLDFASIAITNAPWVTASDWSSGSNALASALNQMSASHSVALNNLYYESPTLSPSPQEWFAFDGVDEITGYTGPAEIAQVVVPVAISGLVVRAMAANVFAGYSAIGSLYLPSSIARLGFNCLANFGGQIGRLPPNLTEVAPYLCDESPFLGDQVVIGDAATRIGFSAFEFATYTTSFVIGKGVREIHARCFAYVGYHAPCAIYWYGDAPEIFYDDGENGPFYYAGAGVTNYVMNPNAVGWGTEFDGRPVVRIPYEAASKADLIGLGGGGVSPLNGAATNLSLYGSVMLQNTQPTNLVLRLSLSNETLIAEHVIP